MAFTSISRFVLVLAVVVTGLSVSPPAMADQVQLHELLFNRDKRQEWRERRERAQRPQRQVQRSAPRRAQRAQPRRTQTARRPARQIQKVSGPQYYTYSAPAVSWVTLASLVPDIEPTGSIASDADALPPMVVLTNDRFAQALEHVPDIDVGLEDPVAEAVRAHYAGNPAFLWVEGMHASATGRQIAELVNDAAAHGLQAEHYAVDLPPAGWSMDDPASRYSELMAFELTLTANAIRYAMDMKDGAIDPNKLSGYHDFPGERLSAKAAMFALANAQDPVRWLRRLEPRQPEYAALRNELRRLQTTELEPIVIPEGIMMRPGTVDEGLPMVMRAVERKIRDETRQKHAETLAAYDGGTAYEGALVELIRDTQRDLNLVADGIVGPKTASRLTEATVESRIDKVRFALERLRWHPEEFGDRHVVINQPEYRVRYFEGDETVLSMRAIVGKPSNQTYFFYDEIDHVVYDPYWGVPQSIIVNEMLPKLWRDRSYLDRNGYVVTTHSGTKVASSAINWRQYNGPVPYNVRQKPGPSNALGELKIMFPNSHAIYMHDTPAKNLFERSSRAYSHGCVRLQDPRAMAAAVLGKSVEHVQSQLGGYEQVERLQTRVPVYVSYFTAWPNDTGEIGYHADIYERDDYLSRAFDAVRTARTS
ncbi:MULTISPECIES: L,D-transpeptidase family protein [unclassified Roseitalea]|uniref:L,D-transpeptidase family protein n=1 Tax=unclassified Roseitalea TaxID=2639107 RepID=UPI00273E5D3F|nr:MULTISPECIES: L,D-transpeptidase family protein [unclassified Roseitalea]